MARTTRSIRGRLPETFEQLCVLHWPRPIHDDVDLENAQEIVDRLAIMGKLSAGQEDYLETVTTLIEKYESDRWAVDSSGLDPIDTLKYLMEGRQMTASDVGRLLGERTLGSKILSGQRQLSKSHIQRLCRHFAVGADVFLK
jgi:antitoxin component HigA of HigAB toxin-antitoxin module